MIKQLALGLSEPKPLRGFPDGRARIRQRNGEFVTVRVKTPEGIREFYVEDSGDFWDCSFERGRNIKAVIGKGDLATMRARLAMFAEVAEEALDLARIGEWGDDDEERLRRCRAALECLNSNVESYIKESPIEQ